MKSKVERKPVSILNRKAKYNYQYIRTLTTGISLVGSEVRSIKQRGISISESYCVFKKNELFVKHIIVPAYSLGSGVTHVEEYDRKLLLKRRELDKLEMDLMPGMSIIPIRLFENERGILKLEIALAKGKKEYDKRETIKKRDTERQLKTEI
jgi:SsrA-binding protein